MEQRLGRGLDSLIARTVTAESGAQDAIPLDSIRVNPNQPRRYWNEDSLAELASSITNHGVLQPIVVHRKGAGFELIAGERRFRASRIAGLKSIPAVIVDSGGLRSLELALIENIQREDLNALDEATAYQQLLNQNGWTHDELAKQVGKSRSAVSNAIRLMDLPEKAQEMLAEGKLSAGQARAILALPSRSEQLDMAIKAADAQLSVRDVERLVRKQKPAKASASRKPATATEAAPGDKREHYEAELRRIFGTKASIQGTSDRGHIRLEFYSPEDRDRLLHQLLTEYSES